MRVLVALGGNAMTSPAGTSSPDDQRAAIARAAVHIANLIAEGHDVVITHGNGPQVGNIMRKNELAAEELPPVSLDWCGAQTQGTLGFTIVNAIEKELTSRGIAKNVTALITRTLVHADDPAFQHPVKPIGAYQDAEHAQKMSAHGQVWKEFGAKGWRRVVPSPAPVRIVETPTIVQLVDAGWVVVAAGGGGIPVIETSHGYRGVSAVIDKDLSAAQLALSVGADRLIIATDVPYAVAGFGTPGARNLTEITADELEQIAASGTFAQGSMGPKVQAILDFVNGGGPLGVIGALEDLPEAVRGTAGTRVRAAN